MASAGVCPGLYRVGSRFYCRYAKDAEVDPAFMPCVMDYWNCEFYKRWKAEEGKRPQALEAAQPPVVEAAAVEVARPEPAPTSPPAQPSLLPPTEDVEELIQRAAELGKLWESYEREARAVIDAWEEVRARLRREIQSLEKSIDAYVAELERLEVKARVGTISEEEFRDLKASIDAELAERTRLKDELEKKLSDLDRVVLPHFKRVKAAEAKPEIAKLRLALAKLDQKLKSGEISRDVYERLRSELEDRIKRLERIREEVEE
uniref:Uncharacterized protein n=1 Tax=Thermofilum pendens TaxID=2269 RepID=A0A7C3WPN7_THEPE